MAATVAASPAPPAAPPAPVHVAIAAIAARRPGAPAVVDDGRPTTYGELLAAARATAARLTAAGVRRGDFVGVGLPRGVGTVASFLGAHLAGAGYVPIDPDGPRGRLERALHGAGVRVAFACDWHAPLLRELGVRTLDPAAPGGAEPPSRLPAGDGPAYALFTSGSTGAPKGVRVGHAALAARVESLAGVLGLGEDDRVLQFASPLWDTAGEEIYGCLTSGGTLIVDDDALSGSLPRLLRLVEREAITVLDLPTGFWEELVAFLLETGDALPPSLRLVVIGGEPVPAPTVERWRRCTGGAVRLLNTYGATETVLVTHAAALDAPAGDRDRFAPIGVPLAHVRQMLRPVPGGADELLVGGPAIADGYLGDPRTTAERFEPDPAGGGARLYRTGDLVRPRPDGSLAFAGRVDRQVKVRGVRLDLGEVEAILRTDARTRCAAAVAYRDRAGRVRLGACVERDGAGDAVRRLDALLREHLPAQVMPVALRAVAALPRLPSGKVDYVRVREAIGPPR